MEGTNIKNTKIDMIVNIVLPRQDLRDLWRGRYEKLKSGYKCNINLGGTSWCESAEYGQFLEVLNKPKFNWYEWKEDEAERLVGFVTGLSTFKYATLSNKVKGMAFNIFVMTNLRNHKLI